MTKKFDDVEIGDQLEMPASRGSLVWGAGPDYDPDAVVRIGIVTHIWYDPVDAKDYVGLAYLRNDGQYGKPTEKRTITGLARSGWRKAQRDWIDHVKAMNEAADKVVSIGSRRSTMKAAT